MKRAQNAERRAIVVRLSLGLVAAFFVYETAAFNQTLCQQERALWMDEYREFHKANRGAPGARYLIYYCGPGQDLCAGTGDRIRGMLYLLRAAAAHRMVYIAEWKNPANLTHFLEPNEIDWRFEGLPEGIQAKMGKQHNTFHDSDFFSLAEYGHNLDKWRSTEVHTTTAWPASIVDHRLWNTTNLWPEGGYMTLLGPLGGVPRDKAERWNREFSWYIDISSCWFHYAFKLSEIVEKRATANVEVAFNVQPGIPLPSYIAWHWRTGGQHGESGIIRQENKEFFRSRLQQLMSSINCARGMALTHGTAAPLLIVTDLNPFRKWIRGGALGYTFTTLPSLAQHVDMGGGQLSMYTDVLADALVLARSHCVVISQSGFSNTALMLSKEPLCYMHMDVCLQQQEVFFEGISVRRRGMQQSAGAPAGAPLVMEAFTDHYDMNP